MAGMTKLLWKAIKKARELPAHDQDAVASVVLAMIDEETVVDFDDDTLAAIEEGLARAELGGFVADAPVADIDGAARRGAGWRRFSRQRGARSQSAAARRPARVDRAETRSVVLRRRFRSLGERHGVRRDTRAAAFQAIRRRRVELPRKSGYRFSERTCDNRRQSARPRFGRRRAHAGGER